MKEPTWVSRLVHLSDSPTPASFISAQGLAVPGKWMRGDHSPSSGVLTEEPAMRVVIPIAQVGNLRPRPCRDFL